ncbi:MAG: hybrid sensor histidine kinase/response regulator [Betaproteobacteria bacterium]|nr:hybrid sensor histidine kinase/response regulator [Betaproteobacteria bacterium]
MAGLKDLDPAIIRQLLETFRVQMEERLQTITSDLLALERHGEPAGRAPLLESMFRAAHNIKGAARGVGLEASAELAHAIEDLFAAWKRGERLVEPGAVDACLRALDALRPMVEAEALGTGLDHSVDALRDELRALAQGLPVGPAAAPGTPPPAAASAIAGDSIRLPVERLDRIADLSEEIQIAKIRLDDHHAGIRHLRDEASQLRKMLERLLLPGALASQAAGFSRDRLSDALDRVLDLERHAQNQYEGLGTTVGLLRPAAGGLRDNARALRMVPAATVLTPLTRSVRDLARELGKDASLALVGEQIEMDRAILQALRDPLMHLLRNAIDHGIEPPDVRRAGGKPESGRITVTLAREGGSVHITVADDGAGIDPARLKEQARRRGIASAEEIDAMDRTAVFDLLFRPGFSTREEVGAVSGRGVGLDVVRVNLQALQGRATVDSAPGKGTRFHLDLPLTLAGEHGLLVAAGGCHFAIPSQYVSRLLELVPDEISDLGATQVVHVGKEAIALRDLGHLLRLGETAASAEGEPIRVVIVHRGWKRMALRVENVLGEREMVVKPLAPPLSRTRFFAGGTLGREGNTILVLEVADLIAAMEAGSSAALAIRRARAAERERHILVVDDSITTRTLEESILSSAGFRVTTAADGEGAWEQLRRETFDLVITDIEMPGMNGFELTRRIKADERLAQIPVIIVTSLGREEDRRLGLEVRADAYIVKSSFESRELLETIGQLL